MEFRPNKYTTHKINPDGSITANISQNPINYLDKDEFEACDLTIIAERNWEFEYTVKKNNFSAYFNDSTNIDNSTLASFEIQNSNGVDRWVNYKLFGANPTDYFISNNKILYKNCFENVDLEYIVNTSKLKENIIINAPITNFDFGFTLKTTGINLEKQLDGSINFIDVDTEEVIWKIESPYIKDAKGQISYNVNYELTKQLISGIEYTKISIMISEDISQWEYPLIIDPTTVISSSDGGFIRYGPSYSWPPTNNIHIDSSPYGGNQYNGVDYYTWCGLVRFNTSSIPSYAKITQVRITSNSWYGGGSSYDNKIGYLEWYNWTPPVKENLYTLLGSPTAGSYLINSLVNNKYEIINNIQNLIKGSYTGFRITVPGPPSTGGNHINYFGSYGTLKLEVTYTVSFAKKILGIQTPNKVMGTRAMKIYGES